MTVYCDECVNFPSPKSKRWGTDYKRNFYCNADIKMSFGLPKGPNDDEWGFQKSRCSGFMAKVKTVKAAKPMRKPFIPTIVRKPA